MSPQAGMILVNEIMPLIQSAVPRVVKPGVGEDAKELVQDAVASAASMVDSMEAAGKKILPSSIAYYAVQRTKVGRRSYSAGSCDPLAPATSIKRKISRVSMDESQGDDTDDSAADFHDTMASQGDDPSVTAARILDWSSFIHSLNRRERAVLNAIAEGRPMKALARKFNVSTPRITQITRAIGQKIRILWGPDALSNAIAEAAWRRGDIRVGFERQACRHERALASAL